MSKVKKKKNNFFLKNEANKQDQNTCLNPKEIFIYFEHFALNSFPTNTMTKNPVFTTQTKTKWKNMVLSLVSRTNQDEI